ncbi:Hypothetical protein CINCED_3A009858 [Cinara cedri]|uniref:Peptidase S1 domain-containing protein n=1 Tax=Cinara cedri TaxID=506608 RepID=A0A5E4N8E2_9HEMI|nr:Hypothetical protein CINCED_3A009858 [Cinara cedri]
MRDNSMSPRRNRLCRCVLVFFPTLVLLLSGRCAASDDKNNGTTTTTTTTTSTSTTAGSASELTLSWTTAEYPTTLMPSPLSGNDTVASVAAGKPSKFDEHVEDWQYVDDPLKNVTAPVVGAAGNSSGPAAFVCKMCAMQMLKNKSPRNKRNHDNRLYGKMPNNKSSRHRDLYAELMAVAASKQSYRRKRFRRSAAAAATSLADAAADSSSTYRRYKRFRRSAYPNGMIRPYRYHGNQQQQYPSLLAADLQQQHNRRRRYRYAADPYHQKRNAGATPWDRSAEFRRRYLRFPPTHDGPPPAYTNNNPWSPSVAPVPPGHPPPPPPPPPQSAIVQQPFSYLPQYPVQQQPPPPPPPAMGPRSPRLVFRDPVDQGTLQAPYGGVGGPNGLQDLLVSQPDDVKGCGVSVAKQQGAQRRIVGGDEAGFGSFPWQAYIRIGSSRCGGSLVNRYHVVTAGHCVARASARQVQVTLGDYVINSAVEPLPAYTFGVRKISVHPFFKFTPQADRFDVAVLRLDRPVQYMPHIAPICLPDKGEDFLGHYGWAAGWGALQAGSRLRPKTLQAVDVPIIDNRQCERWHKSNGINVIIYDEMMCAGYREGSKDSCQGDSGGPLMLEKTGRWYLIGIVSAGYSCAQRGQPGIYHRVPLTVDWISYIINSAQQ